MRHHLVAAIAVAILAVAPARADEVEHQKSPYGVDETMSRLQQAIETAGAKVVAVVDHSGAAAEAGMELRPTKAIIFGNPEMGTPLMQKRQSMAASLPLQIAVYEDDDGEVHVVWAEFEEIAELHGLDEDLEIVERVEKALEKLVTTALAAP